VRAWRTPGDRSETVQRRSRHPAGAGSGLWRNGSARMNCLSRNRRCRTSPTQVAIDEPATTRRACGEKVARTHRRRIGEKGGIAAEDLVTAVAAQRHLDGSSAARRAHTSARTRRGQRLRAEIRQVALSGDGVTRSSRLSHLSRRCGGRWVRATFSRMPAASSPARRWPTCVGEVRQRRFPLKQSCVRCHFLQRSDRPAACVTPLNSLASVSGVRHALTGSILCELTTGSNSSSSEPDRAVDLSHARFYLADQTWSPMDRASMAAASKSALPSRPGPRRL